MHYASRQILKVGGKRVTLISEDCLVRFRISEGRQTHVIYLQEFFPPLMILNCMPRASNFVTVPEFVLHAGYAPG